MFMRIALGYCNSTNILEWPTGILVLVAAAAAAGTTEATSRQHWQYIALCLNFS
jgi:2-methylcitrate dehydratase PrpD